MPGNALLFIQLDVDPAVEDELNAWYHAAHIPTTLGVPGFLSGRRYRAVDAEPKYLALYDLVDADVVESPAYWAARPSSATATSRAKEMYAQFRNLVRGVYERILTCPEPEPTDLSAARYVMLVGLEVDAAVDEEFNAWYNTEHLPYLSRVPGVVRARRYRLHTAASRLEGNPAPYLALYELTAPDVVRSEAWRNAAGTPWTQRNRRSFRRRASGTYELIYPA